MGCSRVTSIGGVVDAVLVSTNMPFSRRCLLSLQAALPLLLTEIFQSAIIYEFYVLYLLMPLMSDFIQAPSSRILRMDSSFVICTITIIFKFFIIDGAKVGIRYAEYGHYLQENERLDFKTIILIQKCQ